MAKSNHELGYEKACASGKAINESMRGLGEDFLFELSEKELSKELAPGEEVELDFVFLENLESVENPEGNFFLHFEGFTSNQKSYVVPTK